MDAQAVTSPADHAATVRHGLEAGRAQLPNADWSEEFDALAALLALADRATELDREAEQLRANLVLADAAADVAEARATELEREREELLDRPGAELGWDGATTALERAQNALRWIEDFAARMRDRHTGFVHIERRARAALGETASTSTPHSSNHVEGKA